jgi:hypothetical protein
MDQFVARSGGGYPVPGRTLARRLPPVQAERATGEANSMRKLIVATTLVLSVAACKKTGENEFQVKTPEVNVSTDSHTVRTPDVDVGSRTDTINTPVVGTKKDTIIVDKPVVGTKKTEVKVPTVDVKKP